ncbi:hypothetical protein [Mesorhizobium sp.]|uniref:hypothetical protein n=1 Tax=Mesorhizobium sp. TaxID=1871066 RepID=UPI001212EC0B|nr:hypothetical protein [Mesorhizobium sp.]TIN11644.1 MAG: hypothetical protein E5Y14_04795 [Mesorhizobium sp.]
MTAAETEQSARSGSMAAGLIGIGITSLFANLLMLTGPLYMMQIYDRVLTSGSAATLIALTVLVVGLYATFSLLDGLRTRIRHRLRDDCPGGGAELHQEHQSRRRQRGRHAALRHRRRSALPGQRRQRSKPAAADRNFTGNPGLGVDDFQFI